MNLAVVGEVPGTLGGSKQVLSGVAVTVREGCTQAGSPSAGNSEFREAREETGGQCHVGEK